MANNPTPLATLIGDQWINLYAASGLTVGDPLLVTCRGQTSAYIAESAGVPSDSMEGIEVYPTRQVIIDKDSAGLWARTAKAGTSTRLIVQLDALSGSVRTGDEITSPDGSTVYVVTVTQAEYDTLSPPDEKTLYLICG